MAMTTFLSRWVGEFGDEGLQVAVAGPQIVAVVVERGAQIASVPGRQDDSRLGGGPAGVVQAVEYGGQAVAVTLHGAEDVGLRLRRHRKKRRADRRAPTSR